MPIIIDQNGRREVGQIEYDAYILSLSNRWNKESNVEMINQLHTELFNKILEEKKYINIGELSFWMQRPESEYYNEAISIFNWFGSTYLLIEQYASTVTEANHQEPEEFIASLPTLNI